MTREKSFSRDASLTTIRDKCRNDIHKSYDWVDNNLVMRLIFILILIFEKR